MSTTFVSDWKGQHFLVHAGRVIDELNVAIRSGKVHDALVSSNQLAALIDLDGCTPESIQVLLSLRLIEPVEKEDGQN